ncbi:MAG: sugar ABC transporter substrate-binding protein [Lachnospiraceae bacterium]|nr:sugar ABC transporter substrate-binding protein [Lachnospiraceae bacterium]
MKKVVAALLTAALTAGLAGCGSKAPAEESKTESAKSETETSGETESEGKKSGRIGISMPTQSSQRWIIEGNEMKDQLEAMGYTVDLQYGEDLVDHQVNQIENMLTKEIDVLIVGAIDSGAMTDIVKKVKDSGALVIAYDRLLMNTENVDYYATFDSIRIGELQGGYIVEKLGLEEGKGPFNIELFAGSLDDNNTALYWEGAMNKLSPYIDNGMLVVKSGQTDMNQCATLRWDGAEAQKRMDNILSSAYSDGSHVDAVLAPYDGISIGVLSSLKAIGYGSEDMPYPIITGQDAEIPSIKSILAGEQTQTVFVNVKNLASVAVTMADQYLSGKEVEVNMVEYYDNGVKKVSGMAIDATSLDMDNAVEELVGSGYYTEEQIME